MTASIPLAKRIAVRAVTTIEGGADLRAKRLLSANSAAVLQYLGRRADLPEDAADLLAEAMLVVWKKRASIPVDDIEARMWFFGVARRLLLSYYRGKSRKEELATALRDHISRTVDVAGLDGGRQGEGQDVRALIAGLPQADQEIVTLVHWDGFSLIEVATVLRIPASTVRSRYRRARARLRREMEAE